MFDSQYTDFRSTALPAGRDFIREYTEAFRAEGLKVGIYYSLIDWHHPDYQIDIFHPLRRDPRAPALNQTRSMDRYRDYVFRQVQELLTNYGKLDVIWFDFTYSNLESIHNEFNQFAIRDYQDWMPWTTAETWHSQELIAMARQLQPGIVINDRTGVPQDVRTPEQTLTEHWPRHLETGELSAWEACHTFSGSWGYARDEMSWKSPEMLLRILIRAVSCGGNLIMNVGPTARGCFDSRADQALEVYGQWMRYHGRAIYGCTKAEPNLIPPAGTLLTQSEDGRRLYIHLVEYPFAEMVMRDLADQVQYAQFLHDASEIRFRRNADHSVSFLIPGIRPAPLIPVVEVFLT